MKVTEYTLKTVFKNLIADIKFYLWFRKEKKKGLQYVHVDCGGMDKGKFVDLVNRTIDLGEQIIYSIDHLKSDYFKWGQRKTGKWIE